MPVFYDEKVQKTDEEKPVTKSMPHYVGPLSVQKAKAKKDGDEAADDDGFQPDKDKPGPVGGKAPMGGKSEKGWNPSSGSNPPTTVVDMDMDGKPKKTKKDGSDQYDDEDEEE